ncbi:hypothetical protein RRG08_008030 [Elysia crispata]|uniref:Uncharacterized protein n=1 Tax=Elysia crispata TaxID=231223 RepID=A0AAE1AIJ8_9GAST|nr:hypothetical protein RRG08_008030 [Elysia crispata]
MLSFSAPRHQVLKAGHTWRRLVGRRHFRPWLVEVPDAGLGDGALSTETGPKKPDGTESANSVLYQVRPWRSFHKGRINVAGLRRVLERVLSDVMVKPGQTVTSLCHQLNPHFLSAVTLDALEILEEIGCVHSVFVSPRPKIDLFSKVSRKVSITTESNRGSTRVVDISVESPLRFASFLEAVHQHCQDPGTQ